MVERMKTTLEEAQANLAQAQRRAQYQANKLRWDEIYEVGDEVLLATRNVKIDQHLLSKVRRRWVGPFSATKVISSVAYELDLPSGWKIHPIFMSLICGDMSVLRGLHMWRSHLHRFWLMERRSMRWSQF